MKSECLSEASTSTSNNEKVLQVNAWEITSASDRGLVLVSDLIHDSPANETHGHLSGSRGLDESTSTHGRRRPVRSSAATDRQKSRSQAHDSGQSAAFTPLRALSPTILGSGPLYPNFTTSEEYEVPRALKPIVRSRHAWLMP